MSGRFLVRLICCGREDGTWGPSSWEEADKFRESYTSGPGVNERGGHERSAIIVDADCEHENAPSGEGACPDCGMAFVCCHACSRGGERNVYHEGPPCREVQPQPEPRKFAVRLICCGRDAGLAGPFSWEEADALREGYLSGPGVRDPSVPHSTGHERSAIIVAAALPGKELP